jgi:hypothetical protein
LQRRRRGKSEEPGKAEPPPARVCRAFGFHGFFFSSLCAPRRAPPQRSWIWLVPMCEWMISGPPSSWQRPNAYSEAPELGTRPTTRYSRPIGNLLQQHIGRVT